MFGSEPSLADPGGYHGINSARDDKKIDSDEYQLHGSLYHRWYTND